MMLDSVMEPCIDFLLGFLLRDEADPAGSRGGKAGPLRSVRTPLSRSSISINPPFHSLLAKHTSTTCTVNSPTPTLSQDPFFLPCS